TAWRERGGQGHARAGMAPMRSRFALLRRFGKGGARPSTLVPSRSAQTTATVRAVHQLVDEPLVFVDPLALRVTGRDASTLARDDVRSPGSLEGRAAIAARTRFAEDEIAAGVERGVRQCVVLGAGLDTFAHRNPHSGLHVYEVDRPATH